MEDFQLDMLIGEVLQRVLKLELQPFTLVGATTRAGLLQARCVIALASSGSLIFTVSKS